MVDLKHPKVDDTRRHVMEVFKGHYVAQLKKLADEEVDETGKRTLRIQAMCLTAIDTYKEIPHLKAALEDPEKLANMKMNLFMEFMPLGMLDVEDMPHVFAEYFVHRNTDHTVDIEYLSRAFELAISRYSSDLRENAIKIKDDFDWGMFV